MQFHNNPLKNNLNYYNDYFFYLIILYLFVYLSLFNIINNIILKVFK